MNEENKEIYEDNLLEDKEENLSSETDLHDNDNKSEVNNEVMEEDSLNIPQGEFETYKTIIVDGKELDFYYEMYRQ